MTSALEKCLLSEGEQLTSERCAIAADLHLDGASEARDAFARLLQRCSESGADLFLLGDVFETWLGRRQLELPTYSQEIALLASATASGVRVVLIPGNRDFLLDDHFCAATGVLLGRDTLDLAIAGERLLLCHGDLFSTSDVAYQRLRRVLRSRFFRTLTRLLPAAALAALAKKLRKSSRTAIGRKDAQTLAPDLEAVGALIDEGFDQVVCGHFHHQRDQSIEGARRQGRFVVIEPFEEGGRYLWSEGGQFEERSVTGSPS